MEIDDGGGGRPKTADEIAEAYKSEPWWYDARGLAILTFAYNSTLPQQIRLFGSNMVGDHLEVACGSGTLLDLTLKWRAWKKLPMVRVVGIDYAESMLAGAIRRFRGRQGFEFMRADAADLPFEDAAFDTVNIANAMHCLPQVDLSLKEMFRVLKPNGVMAANVLLFPRGSGFFAKLANRINDWGTRKGILYTPYHRDDIRMKIMAAGFNIETENVSGNCYNVICRRPA